MGVSQANEITENAAVFDLKKLCYIADNDVMQPLGPFNGDSAALSPIISAET